MPPLSTPLEEIKRKKFIRALQQVGFDVNGTRGNGSHYKATWPKIQKSITIQYKLPKEVLYHALKEIELCSGVTWDEIKKQL